MGTRKKIQGKGSAGRHSAVIPLAHALVVFLRGVVSVDRVSPGRIDVRRTKLRSIKVGRERGSLSVRVVDRGSVQDLRIYCAEGADSTQGTIDIMQRWSDDEGIVFRTIDKR